MGWFRETLLKKCFASALYSKNVLVKMTTREGKPKATRGTQETGKVTKKWTFFFKLISRSLLHLFLTLSPFYFSHIFYQNVFAITFFSPFSLFLWPLEFIYFSVLSINTLSFFIVLNSL